MSTNEIIRKIELLNEYEEMMEELKNEMETVRDSIKAVMLEQDVEEMILVQIGKEGWDCRSLTGIILSQEGDCPTNMVLQTSCRCLRQVVKGKPETALIYLNMHNADKLKQQLEQQHHISLKEFTSADNRKITLKRYDRTAYLKLPKLEFYQLKINFDTLTVEKADPAKYIASSANAAHIEDGIIKTTDFTMDKSKMTISFDDTEYGTEPATFNSWIYGIMKCGFGSPTVSELMQYAEQLKTVYQRITFEKDGSRYYSSKYNRKLVEANIRKAFCDKLDFDTTEELIPEEANLLNIANFKPEIHTDTQKDYYPDAQMVEKIVLDDAGKLKIDPKVQQLIDLSVEIGNLEYAEKIKREFSSHPNKDRSFHYLPYRTDSSFEQTFLDEVLSFDEIEKLGLEVYYNGDRAMTEFKIKCYKKNGSKWSYVGIYTPDFLIIKRKDGKIHKVIVVETKGEIYAKDPTFKDKKTFMETEFSRQNNTAFGYERFDYLYLEDSVSDSDRIALTHKKIREFFGG